MKLFLTLLVGFLAINAISARSALEVLFCDDSTNFLTRIATDYESFNTFDRRECIRNGFDKVAAENQELQEWVNDFNEVVDNAQTELDACEGDQECYDEVRSSLRYQLCRLSRELNELDNGRTYARELAAVVLLCYTQNPSGDFPIVSNTIEQELINFPEELPAVENVLDFVDFSKLENANEQSEDFEVPEFPEFPEVNFL